MSTADFVVVANRLPVDVDGFHPDGSPRFTTSPGGLVSALEPVLAANNGAWVGWVGTPDLEVAPFRDGGIDQVPVMLTPAEYEDFYEGLCNATLWPLYHDLIVRPQYRNHWWKSYQEVNARFAQAVAAVAAPGARVWVQDYQLQLVPQYLKQLRPDVTVGFFLHIPFPPAALFAQLPWREEILTGLLAADVIGVHTAISAKNLLDAAESIGALTSGPADTWTPTATVTYRGHDSCVGAFPISIDTAAFTSCAADPAVQQSAVRLRAQLGDPTTVLLGVDRLDYTKGITHRLEAFEQLLDAGDIDPHTSVLVQIATPSRERIADYRRERLHVEQLVGRINGRFGQLGRPVVHYIHRPVDRKTLVSCYLAADIMLVTPLKDGMNLVAKEYVTCHPDGSGALVLSEFAGAAVELHEAYLCNPFGPDSIAAAMRAALTDDPAHRRQRMQDMAATVLDFDVHRWARHNLAHLPHADHPAT